MFENKLTVNYKIIIFIIMVILLLAFVGSIIDITVMFFGAFVIASSVLPLINKLKNYIPRGVAVALILALVLLGFLLIFIPLLISVANKISEFITELPVYVDNVNAFLSTKLSMKIMGHTLSEYINLHGFENVLMNLDKFAGNILTSGVTAGKIIANSITSILVVSIMVFYLCLDEEHLKNVYLSFFPPKFKKKAGEIINTMTTKVGGYVIAQILSMAGVGLLTYIGLAIIQHPQAPFVGFLTFILDIVPVIGATIAVITGILTGFDGGVGFMLLILAIMLSAQWIENQILRPLLFGKFMDIHPLLVILSILAGAKFLGFAGLILGPAFASLVCILVNELYIKQINK